MLSNRVVGDEPELLAPSTCLQCKQKLVIEA